MVQGMGASTGQLRDAIADEVRVLMVRRHVRQQDVADAIGMGRAALSRRLCGDVPFDLDEVEALAGYFDLDVRDLIPEVSSRDRRSGCFTGQLALELEPSAHAEVDIADHRDATAARRRHPTAAANTDRRRAEVTVGAA